MNKKFALSGVLLATFAVYSIGAAVGSTNFSDPLTGPDSPHIDISASFNGVQAYAYTASGLIRSNVECVEYRPWGPCWKSDRPINRTVSSDFVGDFVAQIDVSEVGQTDFDIAFFGFGPGDNPGDYTEPNGFVFRIHAAGGDAQQIDAGYWTGSGFIEFDRLQIADYNNGGVPTWDAEGGETFVIERSGDSLTMSMVGGNSVTYSISAVETSPGGIALDSSNSRLFFGNTSAGTIFSNFSVESAVQDGDADGINDDDDLCPDTAGSDQVDANGCSDAQVDADGDGVCDAGAASSGPSGCSGSDSCPDTVDNRVDADGCSGEQNVASACPVDGSYKNHGKYVSCVSDAAEDAQSAGLISDEEKDAIVSSAAQSDIGKKSKRGK